MIRVCNLLVSLTLTVFLIACASHPRRVDCEGKLQPINPPAPVAHSDGAPYED